MLKNNPSEKKNKAQWSHVVYKFTCQQEKCEVLHSTYIGMTTTKINKRMTIYLASGAPRNHMRQQHQTMFTREFLENNTTIIEECNSVIRIPTSEVLHIKELKTNQNFQSLDLEVPLTMRKHSDAEADQSGARTDPTAL